MTIVYDLDGTLSRVNTYKVFLIILFVHLIVTLQWLRLKELMFIIYQRLIRKSARVNMKSSIYKLYNVTYYKRFLLRVFHLVMKPWYRKEILLKHSNLDRQILATAAFDFYAKEVADKLHIKECVATSWHQMKQGYECISERKRNCLQALTNPMVIDVFYTDHSDDLPTIKIANKTVLVSPSKKSREIIMNNVSKMNVEFYK